MFREIQISWIVQGHKVNMRMRYINTNNCGTNFNARADLFQSFGNFTTEQLEFYEKFVIQIKNIVHLLLRNA